MDTPATLALSALAPMVRWLRHERVLLDFDLARLYGVENRALKQAVRRNLRRFPADFLFQLNDNEAMALVSQSVIPDIKRLGGAMPFAFTEQGVAMLSGILRSDRAIDVNIAIMRTLPESPSVNR